MAYRFSLQVFLIVLPGLAALQQSGCSPLPDEAGRAFSAALKTGGCQGCSPSAVREGEGEEMCELEGEGEFPTTEEGEGEGQAEGEDVEPEPECAVLDAYSGDRQVLMKWSCPNENLISKYVLLRGTEIPIDSKGFTVGGYVCEVTRTGSKSAYTCEQVYSGMETSFLDEGLTNGQEYLYTLRGYDADGTVICRGYEACVPMEQRPHP